MSLRPAVALFVAVAWILRVSTPALAVTATYVDVYDPTVAQATGTQAQLLMGTDGSFYGVASFGGSTFSTVDQNPGYGTAWKITPGGSFTPLYSFTGGDDGASPIAGGLTQGADGYYYGVTSKGGAFQIKSLPADFGTIFRMTPSGKLSTIYSFTDTVGIDGKYPVGGLVLAPDGNFYGTTALGGVNGVGTIFRVSPSGALVTLHSFGTSDGVYPDCLILGPDGNFYGATLNGGAHNGGVVFKMTPAGSVTVLHSFSGDTDGDDVAGVTFGSDGKLYGVAEQGGYAADGTFFKGQHRRRVYADALVLWTRWRISI